MVKLSLLVVASLVLGTVLCGSGWYPMSSGESRFPTLDEEKPLIDLDGSKLDGDNTQESSNMFKDQQNTLFPDRSIPPQEATDLLDKPNENNMFTACYNKFMLFFADAVKGMQKYYPAFKLLTDLISAWVNRFQKV